MGLRELGPAGQNYILQPSHPLAVARAMALVPAGLLVVDV